MNLFELLMCIAMLCLTKFLFTKNDSLKTMSNWSDPSGNLLVVPFDRASSSSVDSAANDHVSNSNSNGYARYASDCDRFSDAIDGLSFSPYLPS